MLVKHRKRFGKNYRKKAQTGLDIKKMKGIIKDGIAVLAYKNGMKDRK